MNWKTLIAELMAAGLTQPQIAKHCGCSQATVSELASGVTAQPRYPLGAALVALHQQTTAPQAPPAESVSAKAGA